MKKRFFTVATSLTRPGSQEKLVGANGELNASSKKDLLQAIACLVEASKDSKIVTEEQANVLSSAERRELVMAAFKDKQELAALGDNIAENIAITSNRDGFARRFLRYQDLQQGSIPRATMSRKDIRVSVATGPTQVEVQLVRDNEYYPAEFNLTARPFIAQVDIARSNEDILEQKYTEALEGTMVAEDRVWKSMADRLVNIGNPHINVAGEFNPKAFARASGYLQDYGIAPGFALLASDLWADIVSSSDWAEIIDPVSQNELLLTGKLGTIHGMELLSDQFRHENHKVLNAGEFYVVSAPHQHGQITDRGGVTSTPIDIAHEGIPGKGWALTELLSMVIVNPYSVIRGRRTV